MLQLNVRQPFMLVTAATAALLSEGETFGVFQMESAGMRRYVQELQPQGIREVAAMVALFRPGPMDNIPAYIRRKHGQEPVPRVHSVVDRHTASTYGVMVYQEQVMRILNRLGGIELPQSYQCIKAISKKKLETIAKYREQLGIPAARLRRAYT